MVKRVYGCGQCGKEYEPPVERGIFARPGTLLSRICPDCRSKLLARSKWGVQAQNVK
jgi:DNA-directed RNA polymerase subunit RPC12/RpoP